MRHFVKEITWLGANDTGWGNGYVCIPKDHPLYGIDYDKIHDLMPELSVHGGLTFSASSEDCHERKGGSFWAEIPTECHEGFWIVGFDCAHYGDSRSTCNETYVRFEASKLATQLEAYKS